MSFETVDFSLPLEDKYKNKFDTIFSLDTLEHIKEPNKFFNNVNKALKKDGTALIGFPNESKEKHHGLTWFDTQDELNKAIGSDLKIIKIKEVKETWYFSIIKNYLWNPIMIISSKMSYKKNKPQIFEDTTSYSLNENKPLIATLMSIYPNMLMILIKFSKMFIYKELNNKINNKYLLIKLKK